MVLGKCFSLGGGEKINPVLSFPMLEATILGTEPRGDS
jgi:hypothetical protein